jgi:hypothetical protein
MLVIDSYTGENLNTVKALMLVAGGIDQENISTYV